MNNLTKTATIFGGTGFIGRQIVRELALKGYAVRVATRVPEKAYFLKPCGAVGQISAVACDYRDQKSIDKAVEGADFVVNTIGILFQKRRSRFDLAHIDVAEMIAKSCRKHKVSRFVHISALGCDTGRSRYAHSKIEGEDAIYDVLKSAVILRPSIVFGPDDDFFNKFAAMSKLMPALPLIGGGHTRFQPVYVGDVADAVMTVLHGPEDLCGQIYELGGPEVKTFKELLQIMKKYTGAKSILLPLPWFVAKFMAVFLSLLPKPLLTTDQVDSLKTDNVVSDQAKGFKELGITPKAMSLILPGYLETFRAGGRFADKKQHS